MEVALMVTIVVRHTTGCSHRSIKTFLRPKRIRLEDLLLLKLCFLVKLQSFPSLIKGAKFIKGVVKSCLEMHLMYKLF